jgi:endonuclease-3
MPVDTHVYRVARRLGLIDPRATVEQAHTLLEQAVEADQIYAFHEYLITHGRRVCKAQRPLCHECVLEHDCPSSRLRGGQDLPGKPMGRRSTAARVPRP